MASSITNNDPTPQPKPMMELIYVVRHGRTALNAQDRFRGRADPPLDQVGHVEALTAARTLEDLGLLAVHTSPLRRALETAGPIAERAGVPVHVVLGLTDLDYGRWEGRTRVEAAAADPVAFERFLRDPVNATLPRGRGSATWWSARDLSECPQVG